MGAIVKICGITNPADATAAVAAGADALGLMFYEPSSRNVSLETAAAIAGVIPDHVLKAGVFVNAPKEFVLEAIRACNLNLLQFHGDESPEYCAQFPVMTIKAFRIRDETSLKPLPNYQTHAYLLDAHVENQLGGTGAKFNWNLAVIAQQFGKPIFLAGGLTPENVAAAVRQVHPYAVDVSSGVEASPGKKDAAKLRDFIAAAKSIEY